MRRRLIPAGHLAAWGCMAICVAILIALFVAYQRNPGAFEPRGPLAEATRGASR